MLFSPFQRPVSFLLYLFFPGLASLGEIFFDLVASTMATFPGLRAMGKEVLFMARNYAALPHEYLEEMDELNDEEFGRLCRALLRYSMSGEETALPGAERLLFKRVCMQEQRFQASYDALTASRREAGKKGAAKRWHGGDGGAMPDDGKSGYTDTNTETETQTNTDTKTKTDTKLPPATAGRETREIPTPEQVREAADAAGCPALAQPFYDYYQAAGWWDSEGKPVYSWRQKLQAWKLREGKSGRKSWAELAAETEVCV